MEDFLGLTWQENARAGKKKKKESASCIDSGKQARRWKQVTNRTPQQMTLEAAQRQLVGHDHPLFLPTSNHYAFDFNRKPPPFLKGNHDAALKFPFPRQVHDGPALGGMSSINPPFISQALSNDLLDRGSLGQTPEIRSEAMLSQRPPQLTIFYGDGVHVYSGITPEKAELIMSMAKDRLTAWSASRTRQHLEVTADIHRPRATYPQGTTLVMQLYRKLAEQPWCDSWRSAKTD
ncbi:protein TIFY 6B-like isoform X2 [Rhodamnia argentea]|uniref:Protein TIFY n=1 Tax=Rhodamnia argentea TaxID=178133 RepID=A0ABM3H338_9MYRT|nr:protein TIFY 6B-like isoform X2 [Rhodamnia argentea]